MHLHADLRSRAAVGESDQKLQPESWDTWHYKMQVRAPQSMKNELPKHDIDSTDMGCLSLHCYASNSKAMMHAQVVDAFR